MLVVIPPPLFDNAPGGCSEYIATRDHFTKQDVRAALTRGWEAVWRLCPEEPTQFVRQFRTDFHGRSWELFLLKVLLDAGLALERSPGEGPDICLRLASGQRCWIEAVVPRPGTGVDSVPQRGPDWRGGMLYSEEGLILRYCSSLNEKLEAIKRYQYKGIVAADDAVLVAVSQGAILDSDMHDDDLPAIVQAVLPIGETVMLITPYGGQSHAVRTLERAAVLKKNGNQVSTRFFLDPATSGISGVLFARHNVSNLDGGVSYGDLLHPHRHAHDVALRHRHACAVA